jgi:hypothetical protein
MAEVLTCPGCGEDLARGPRQPCDRCGHVIPEPTVDVPTWEGRAPLRWYVNGYMRALAQRDDLPRYVRIELRFPWLLPASAFAVAILFTLSVPVGPPDLAWVSVFVAVALWFGALSSIGHQRALAIAVEELRRHGLLRES